MTREATIERSAVRVFLRGNQHLKDCLLSTEDGGSKLDAGIKELVAEGGSGISLEIATEPCDGVASFQEALKPGDESRQGRSSAFEFEPDIVLVSLEPDLMADSPASAEGFQENLHEVIRLVKTELGSHIIVLTASTIDPSVAVSNYHGIDPEPTSLRAHRLDLAVMRLSFEEGISLVDADRILAELGAREHVSGFLDYSQTACGVLAAEFVRVIEDYGFLDERPLIPQMGRDKNPS